MGRDQCGAEFLSLVVVPVCVYFISSFVFFLQWLTKLPKLLEGV